MSVLCILYFRLYGTLVSSAFWNLVGCCVISIFFTFILYIIRGKNVILSHGLFICFCGVSSSLSEDLRLCVL